MSLERSARVRMVNSKVRWTMVHHWNIVCTDGERIVMIICFIKSAILVSNVEDDETRQERLIRRRGRDTET